MVFSENFHTVLCPQFFWAKFMQLWKGWAEWPTRSHSRSKCTTIILCNTWQWCFYFLTKLLPWLVIWQCLADITRGRDYDQQSVHNAARFRAECMWDDEKMVDWQAVIGRLIERIITWPRFGCGHSRLNSPFALSNFSPPRTYARRCLLLHSIEGFCAGWQQRNVDGHCRAILYRKQGNRWLKTSPMHWPQS